MRKNKPACLTLNGVKGGNRMKGEQQQLERNRKLKVILAHKRDNDRARAATTTVLFNLCVRENFSIFLPHPFPSLFLQVPLNVVACRQTVDMAVSSTRWKSLRIILYSTASSPYANLWPTGDTPCAEIAPVGGWSSGGLV